MKKSVYVVNWIIFGVLILSSVVHAEEFLTWQDCVNEASKNNPDLTSALEQVNQAKASKEITRSALLPNITSSASESTRGGEVANSKKDYTNTFAYGVEGQQLIFDGFKASYNLSVAEENIRTKKYYYDVTSSNVRLSLRRAFVALLRAQELVKVTESIRVRREQNLDLVELRYEGGREHKGSLMTSQADLTKAEYDVSSARRAVYYAERQLIKELGRYGMDMDTIVANGDFDVKDQEHERPDFDFLAETTPLLKQLITEKEAARYGLRSAKAQFFPTIYVTGTAGKTDYDFLPQQDAWSGGVNVSFPLFEGGERIANVKKAKAILEQSKADERSGRDGVILTLASTWTDLRNALEFVEVQRQYLVATAERAKVAKAEYSIGLLTFDNWIIIEDNRVAAEKAYLEAKAAALTAEANWIQAKGGTLNYDAQ